MSGASVVANYLRLSAWAVLLACVLVIALQALDNDPPFQMLAATVNTPQPGGLLEVDAIVRRDLKRGCSVTFSRHILDSSGARLEVVAQQVMTPRALEELERANPGRLRLRIPVAPFAAPGPAQLVTPLEYRCNEWQSTVRPLAVTMVIAFRIAPP